MPLTSSRRVELGELKAIRAVFAGSDSGAFVLGFEFLMPVQQGVSKAYSVAVKITEEQREKLVELLRVME
jgi:hypothetical protein